MTRAETISLGRAEPSTFGVDSWLVNGRVYLAT